MAIVTYKCDVCKRTIDLQRNIHGLETPNRCIITHGCRGNLYFNKLLPDFVRGKTPDDVVGLDNWQQRAVLYDHEQAIARDAWSVEHNLGNSVNVSAFVNIPTEDDPDNLVEIEPDDIIIVSPDEITLKFSRPYSGKAQLVARASDPQLLQPLAPVAVSTKELRQLSNLGEITVATKVITSPIEEFIQLRFIYTTPQETTQQIDYIADDVPSGLSPWIDYDNVIINGGLYIVRSFNAIQLEMTNGVIGNGSTFKITSIDEDNTGSFRPIAPDEVFLLLTSAPYTAADKVTSQVIDVVDVNDDSNSFAFAYDSGEFFADSVVEQTIYPPVRSA